MAKSISLKADLIKDTLRDLKKFLGTKFSPIQMIIYPDKVEFTQSSEVSIAKVTIQKSRVAEFPKIKHPLVTTFDSEWIRLALSKVTKDTVIKISLGESITSLTWKGKKTSIANSPEDSVSTIEKPESDNLIIPKSAVDFARKHSSILRMKSHFSDKPLSATLGMLKERPYLLVNDQYHGVLILSPKKCKPFEKFSLDSNAMSAIMFDPKSVETSNTNLYISEGRIFIQYKDVEYELPSFEPSAVPSVDEIKELLSLINEKEMSHKASFNTSAMLESSSLSKQGEDATQSFSIMAKKDELSCVYASSHINSNASVIASVKNWKEPLVLDPNMFNEIMEKILSIESNVAKEYEDKENEKATNTEALMSKHSNVFVLSHSLTRQKKAPTIFGFMVTQG